MYNTRVLRVILNIIILNIIMTDTITRSKSEHVYILLNDTINNRTDLTPDAMRKAEDALNYIFTETEDADRSNTPGAITMNISTWLYKWVNDWSKRLQAPTSECKRAIRDTIVRL